MGRRGPRKKSEQLEELEGNTGHRNNNQPEDAHRKMSSLPDPPSYLDEITQAIFLDICQLLFDAGRLTNADIHAIEQYADSYAQWVAAVKRRDAWAAEHDGEPKAAHVKMCRELSSDLNRWSRVLCIAPYYRAATGAFYGLGGESSNKDADEVADPVLRAVCG